MVGLPFVGLLAIFIVETYSSNCLHGWKQHQNSCYVFIEDLLLDFTEAESFCTRLQGKLAEVESADENVFLKNYLKHNTTVKHNFWLGGTDAVIEGEWMWMTTMDPFEFTDWSSYSPDNYESHQDCVMFFLPDHYQWNDHYCDVKAGFICESEASKAGQDVIG